MKYTIQFCFTLFSFWTVITRNAVHSVFALRFQSNARKQMNATATNIQKWKKKYYQVYISYAVLQCFWAKAPMSCLAHHGWLLCDFIFNIQFFFVYLLPCNAKRITFNRRSFDQLFYERHEIFFFELFCMIAKHCQFRQFHRSICETLLFYIV